MKIFIHILVILLFFACNSNTQKKKESKEQVSNKKAVETKVKSSANYSALFTDYTCNMGISEMAKALQVSQEKLTLVTFNSNTKRCYVDYEAPNILPVRLSWGLSPSSKKGNKKLIDEALEFKRLNISPAGISIELAETGDCYLRHSPMHGRITLLNSNYDNVITLDYGTRMQPNGERRSNEAQEALKQKISKLANYLLKKYKK